MDSFYRLFMIPSMGHCIGGFGAWEFAQGVIQGGATSGINKADHNVILGVVDWVENNNPPGVIIGMDENGAGRKHCM